MKGRQIAYSAEELAWIKANAKRPRREAHVEFCARFGRSDVSVENYKALCNRNGWKTGRTGCFGRGNKPHNKGKPFKVAGSEKGHFKRGQVNGRAADLYKPIGTERTSKDGYTERKMHDGQPSKTRWQLVHLLRWEEANGPLPEGHCLKCLDGDKANTEPSNWEAIPRALLPRLAGGRWRRLNYDDAEPEVKPALLVIAKLEHAAREAKNGGTHA